MAEKSASELLKGFDWYSSDRYRSPENVVNMLRRRGYNDREVEAILRSKWTRWAADAAGKSSQATAPDLARWMDDRKNRVTRAAVEELVRETFPETRGRCESRAGSGGR